MEQHTQAVGRENARMRAFRLNPDNVPFLAEPGVENDLNGPDLVTDIDE